MASNLRTKKVIVYFLFLASFFLIHTVSFAKPVTADRALQVAANWMLQQTGVEPQIIDCNAPGYQDDFQDGITPYYIFSIKTGGWVIVSGDDIAYPIIGYSAQGALDSEDKPPAFIEWMALIEKEIREEVNIDSEPLLSIQTAWEKFDVTDYDVTDQEVLDEAVGPLIKTTWSQGKYYNKSCPYDSSGPDNRALVGCVATAAGQIMKYHNWPATGTGSHSYVSSRYGTLSASFGATTYNFSSMPASGQLTSYNTAVATMLYHVGVSVNMNYGPSSSGAISSSIPAALRTYFKYNANNFVNRSSYTTVAWVAKLKADHNAGRPVYYRSPGHAFICDGYNDSGYFHFNWGWNGSYDGYFLLNDLTPGSHNYNANQGGNFGIYPAGGTQSARVLSLWGVTGAKSGETARLWARVNNNGSVTLPSSAAVWYYVTGPSWSGSHYVGYASVSGFTPGYTGWRYKDWSIPSTRTSGTHSYWARVWNSSTSKWLGDWKGPQNFTVSSGGTESAKVLSLWTVTGAACGKTSTLWARVQNTGSANLGATTRVWYYVTGPSWSGSHYVASTSVSGITPGASFWRSGAWAIPSTRASGTHTYWAMVWNSTTSKMVSPWSASQNFTVTCGGGYTQWGIWNPVYCLSKASLTFRGYLDGKYKYSVTYGNTTPTWQGYQSTTPGYKTLTYSIYGACISTKSGSWKPSTYFQANRKYYFKTYLSSGKIYIALIALAADVADSGESQFELLEAHEVGIAETDGLNSSEGISSEDLLSESGLTSGPTSAEQDGEVQVPEAPLPPE